jgi:predicted phage terminase large subunit-like protein
MMLDPEEIKALQSNLDKLGDAELMEVLEALEELEKREAAKHCRDDLIAFCQHMDPNYKVGKHHRRLANLLMAMERGEEDRIGVSVPPRHGKSQLVSIYFPAWYLGRNPDKKVLMVSHTADLAVDFGRKVRNLVGSDAYKEIFPTVSLSADSKSAGRWNTNAGGEYFACGVGAALAGRGAHFLIVDDPFSEQDVLNGNYEVFEKAYEWFTYGARTRLMPQGKVAIVHCMVGDTPVLMGDNTEKPLRYVRPGDEVATYDRGKITTAKVLNWANQGIDRVYAIRMTSGTIVRANERHPFLVKDGDVLKWIKTKHLKPNMTVVKIGNVSGAGWSADTMGVRSLCTPDIYASGTTELSGAKSGLKTHLPKSIGGSIKTLAVALRGVITWLKSKACAEATTIRPATMQGGPKKPPISAETRTSCIGTESASRSTTLYGKPNKANVQFATNPQTKQIPHLIGKVDSGLTTATDQQESEPSYVTDATSLLRTGSQSNSCNRLSSIYVPTLDTIAEIYFDGFEDVFDIQVEGTENFIANGIVSHNTRWHPNDLIGRLAKDMVRIDGTDQYHFFEFPAIFNENTEDEKALWPEFFDLEALHRTKASMPLFQWNAQYQQNPTAEEGALIKREWWKKWEKDDPPQCEYIIMTLDAAAEKNNRADFTALLTWGVFSDDELTKGASHIILLNSINTRVEFHQLKELALREWKEWQPDSFIVEKKSSGTPLFQELRRMGIPVQEFTPHRGTGDKIARINAVSDIVRAGMVWYPEGRKWAEEVVEQVAAFPASDHDDMVDCVSMALARFRNGGFIRLDTDEQDEIIYPRKAAYY